MGRMRQEIDFYRKCFDALQSLRENSYNVYEQLFMARHLEDLQQITHLVDELYQAITDSVKQEAKAERNWMEFWGLLYKGPTLEGELF